MSLWRPALVLALLALSPCAGAEGISSPPSFVALQVWAGPDASALAFTQDKVAAFLAARTRAMKAGQEPEWSAWLKTLEAAKGPNLRAWALTRRVEAGDYEAYPALQEAVTEHLLGMSKPGSGRADRVITTPPLVAGFGLPDALHIDHASVFWASLRKTLQAIPDRSLSTGLYAVWCFGTHPDQRDLILDLTAHVETPITLRNPSADPWNDPRFWIVLDWVLAWGSEADLIAIRTALPAKGPARSAFDRVIQAMEETKGYFSKSLLTPTATGARKPAQDSGQAVASLASTPEVPSFDFTQIKVLEQPPPPRYPKEASQRKMMTNLVLRIVVDPQGNPVSCRPRPGPWLGFFAPTGVAYGMRWHFQPATLNGVPQSAQFFLTLPFRMRN